MPGTVSLKVDSSIATVVLDRPEKHNAITPGMAGQLAAAVRTALSTPLEAGLRYENELHVVCMQSLDHREGIKAFQDKRPGEFKGRQKPGSAL